MKKQKASKSVWIRVKVKLPGVRKAAPLPPRRFSDWQIEEASYRIAVMQDVGNLMAAGSSMNDAAHKLKRSTVTICRWRQLLVSAGLWPMPRAGRLTNRLKAVLRPKISTGRPKKPTQA